MSALDLLTKTEPEKRAPKIKAPKHDFKDGTGKVFAHRHINGGGWVADTARVADSVRVGTSCSVYQFARITDNVILKGKAKVFGHAKIMNNVTLSGNASVYGQAIVYDRANLTENTIVCDNARVSGASFCEGHVVIYDDAIVHNTSCRGPALPVYTLSVRDDAKVFDSQLRGPTIVQDDAHIQNSSGLFCIRCRDAGKIINTTMSTCIDNDVMRFIFAARHRRRRAVEAITPDIARQAPEIGPRMIDVSGIIINSQIYMRACNVPPAALILNCRISTHMQNTGEIFPAFPDGPLFDVRVTSLQALVSRYNQPAQTAAMSAIAAIGAVPQFDHIRQRRIMRIE